MSDLSILIPHKHTPHNDEALAICLDCIIKNTRCDYELLVDTTTPADPYSLYNTMAAKASAKWIVFGNSDVFFARDWDTPLLEAARQYRIVTGVLVECGAIPVSDRNIEMDFGRTPFTFHRFAFEDYVQSISRQPIRETGGWFFPCLMHKGMFLQRGGFDTKRGAFPTPLDGYFWDNWKAIGNEVKQVNSFAYHLQNYSDEERTKEARANG